jgi:outer membrane lipoprotein-sorting protein
MVGRAMLSALYIFFISLVFSTAAFGGEVTVEDILDKMQAAESRTKDLKFKFTQEIEFKVVGEKHRIEGELTFKYPNKIVHKQIKPREQLIVSNGKKLWIYNPVTRQVYVDKWKNWKGITYFLPGIFHKKGKISNLKKVFTIEICQDATEKKNYVLHFLTKKKKKAAKYLPGKFEFYLWVNKVDMYPRKSKFMAEDFICITEIEDWEINLNPPEDMFHFKVPEGVEVFKLK